MGGWGLKIPNVVRVLKSVENFGQSLRANSINYNILVWWRRVGYFNLPMICPNKIFTIFKTSTCMQWTLYLLAKHQRKQELLWQEFFDHQSSYTDVGTDYKNMSYLKAVVKESLR